MVGWCMRSDTWNVGNKGHVEAASSNYSKSSARIHRIQI